MLVVNRTGRIHHSKVQITFLSPHCVCTSSCRLHFWNTIGENYLGGSVLKIFRDNTESPCAAVASHVGLVTGRSLFLGGPELWVCFKAKVKRKAPYIVFNWVQENQGKECRKIRVKTDRQTNKGIPFRVNAGNPVDLWIWNIFKIGIKCFSCEAKTIYTIFRGYNDVCTLSKASGSEATTEQCA